MSEILGLGITHQPTLAAAEFRPMAVRRALADPLLPERHRQPDGWPVSLRLEWGDDQGLAACARHRAEVVAELAKVRAALDEFKPDLVLIWGDDQYENFREDIIPAFCVLAADHFDCAVPQFGDQPNVWADPPDRRIRIQGHPRAARYLASALLEGSFDVAYAYELLHDQLGHAFLNSVLYLDWARRGFGYPVVPFTVNCYGRRVIKDKGRAAPLSESPAEDQLDPPSPSPHRCFELGAASARALADSPWRVALIASSSWSHAFLTDKTFHLVPDQDADRELYSALEQGDYQAWLKKSLADIESSGQQEMLNWFCLLGAMDALGRRPDYTALLESSVANSDKVMAVFNP